MSGNGRYSTRFVGAYVLQRTKRSQPYGDGIQVDNTIKASTTFVTILHKCMRWPPPEPFGALYPLDIKWRKALAGRHHFNRIDIDVRGQGGDPVSGLGDIARRQGLGALVDLGCRRIVALETDVGKLRAAAQARGNIGGAHARTHQV